MPWSQERVAVGRFLSEVRRIRGTGAATAEQSYYPCLNRLFSDLGQLASPKRRALSNPAAIAGDFPDVALYEEASLVLALPAEVKPASVDIPTILGGTQAKRYARSFGGGRVLVTNLRAFAVAELDAAGTLVPFDQVDLVATEADLDRPSAISDASAGRLASMIDAACALRPTMADGRSVAKLLAYHAGKARDAVVATGSAEELLRPVAETMRQGLGMRLDDTFLVPTVVQTLTYGLFAAWLTSEDPRDFDWMAASYRLEIPVFADMVHSIMRPAFIRACDLTPYLSAAARTLTWVDRAAFAAQFEGGAIEYFYEPFLASFDATLRDELGVWYTPAEIARYQVAAVERRLVDDLGIADGFADDSVYVLDPAVGTGTYLAAVLRRIYDANIARGEPPTIAAQRTLAAATSRVIGFEILPAAFVICHLHLARQLAELGTPVPSGTRLRVYLTNSLLGWLTPPAQTDLPIPDFEEEVRQAQIAKTQEPILVVIGNPPYHGYSRIDDDEERALLAPWIDATTSTWGLRKHRMTDLYVRFWRMALQRIVSLSGRGVASFITNRKWLGGRSYPAMREAIARSFDRVVVADLHGGTHDTSVPGDESIFTTLTAAGIRVGTAVVTAVKLAETTPDTVAVAVARDFRGSASDKRAQLDTLSAGDVEDGFAPRVIRESRRYKFTDDPEGDYPSLDEYFEAEYSGIQTLRDASVIDGDRGRLERRMRDFYDPSIDFADLIRRHPEFSEDQPEDKTRRIRNGLLTASTFRGSRIVRYLFRPFDLRWIYWEPELGLLHRPRPELIPLWLNVPEQKCIVAPQTPRRPGAARPIASAAVPSWAAADPDARAFPRLRLVRPEHGDPDGIFALAAGAVNSTSNVAQEWIAAARNAGLTGADADVGDVVFYSLLAVSHSPIWLGLQPIESDDFVQIPLPATAADLQSAAELGRRIFALHDTDTDVAGVTTGTIERDLRDVAVPDPVTAPPVLAYGRYGHTGGLLEAAIAGRASILWAAGEGWRNVPVDVWEYRAVGHQLLPKWLSYRVGSPLEPSDREAFTKICRRIAKLIQLQPEADTLFHAALASALGV